MPGTTDERFNLVAEITRMCADVLGYPTRQANRVGWSKMPIGDLRIVHANWKALMPAHEVIHKLFS